jgi:hypothetical protein
LQKINQILPELLLIGGTSDSEVSSALRFQQDSVALPEQNLTCSMKSMGNLLFSFTGTTLRHYAGESRPSPELPGNSKKTL